MLRSFNSDARIKSMSKLMVRSGARRTCRRSVTLCWMEEALDAQRLLRFAFRLDSRTEKELVRATVQVAMEKEQSKA